MGEASCLCGSVRWSLAAPPQLMWHCHCGRCRKRHGTAFATMARGAAAGFRFEGRENVVHFESSPGVDRPFCGRCGSEVPKEPTGEFVSVLPGNADGDPGLRPSGHIFTASKAPWYAFTDALPRYETLPAEAPQRVLPDLPTLDPPGAPRGSCLCGGVRFVVSGPPITARNCHYGRCRRGRAAAHASNLVTRLDGVRFTRGEGLLTTYKVPEAKHFSQVFCRVCGAKMPRLDPGRSIAIVPMGALDDDPGIAPREHIFTGSKAPWFDITDALPQHLEGPPPA